MTTHDGDHEVYICPSPVSIPLLNQMIALSPKWQNQDNYVVWTV